MVPLNCGQNVCLKCYFRVVFDVVMPVGVVPSEINICWFGGFGVHSEINTCWFDGIQIRCILIVKVYVIFLSL